MKQIKLTTGEYLLVEVPEDAHSFEIYANNVIGGWCIMYLRGNPDYACEYSPNLPTGQWEIIGRASELSEEQWEVIVERQFDTYLDYEEYLSEDLGNLSNFYFSTATESGLSLIKPHSMNPETTLVIKKN